MSIQFSKDDRADILGRLLPLAQSYDRLTLDMDLYENDQLVDLKENSSEKELVDQEVNPLDEKLVGQEEKALEEKLKGQKEKAMREKLIAMNNEIQELLEFYMKGLPIRDLSRCPFTGEKVSMAIDDIGLDGLWWNYDAPKRPENELPDTWFAIDGALKLKGEIEKAPFLCSPGPDIPFVIPRLLEYIQVKAVISTIQIGSHIAYPICYYADPMLYGELRVNDWGTGRYWETGSMIPELWSPGQYISLDSDEAEYDFDLEPWIKSGKLLWIAPGDDSMTLHGHVSGCPYLDLQGSRSLKFIRDGLVWEDEEELEFFDEDDPSFDSEHFQSILKQIKEGNIDE